MLGLIAAYAYGKRRGRRERCDIERYDPEYQVYETGVVLGVVVLLFAWPIALAYWFRIAGLNWWAAIGIPGVAALIGIAFVPLWVIGAVVAITIFMFRLQKADEERNRYAED